MSPVRKDEYSILTTSNSLLPAHLLDINRRVREVHIPHSSHLQRSRFYHSRIKNEHSTQGERKKSIILVALKHHNKETEKHRMRSYTFLKAEEGKLPFFTVGRNINEIDWEKLVECQNYTVVLLLNCNFCTQWAITYALFYERKKN